MKVVVGLGNPGSRYRETRHNLGFVVLEVLAERWAVSHWRRRFDAHVAETVLEVGKVLLIAPQTFMNCSGRSVRQAADFFQLPLEDLLVVCDDIALPLGEIRLRREGSAGGHKGVKDIVAHLGTNAFARLRIGVGAQPAGQDAAEWVLERFPPGERKIVDESKDRAADAVEVWLAEGIDAAMNRFN